MNAERQDLIEQAKGKLERYLWDGDTGAGGDEAFVESAYRDLQDAIAARRASDAQMARKDALHIEETYARFLAALDAVRMTEAERAAIYNAALDWNGAVQDPAPQPARPLDVELMVRQIGARLTSEEHPAPLHPVDQPAYTWNKAMERAKEIVAAEYARLAEPRSPSQAEPETGG